MYTSYYLVVYTSCHLVVFTSWQLVVYKNKSADSKKMIHRIHKSLVATSVYKNAWQAHWSIGGQQHVVQRGQTVTRLLQMNNRSFHWHLLLLVLGNTFVLTSINLKQFSVCTTHVFLCRRVWFQRRHRASTQSTQGSFYPSVHPPTHPHPKIFSLPLTPIKVYNPFIHTNKIIIHKNIIFSSHL